MSFLPDYALVESLVATTFEELGVDAEARRDLHETILIAEGRYQGRSFRCGGLMAMWLIEVGLVQFYAADGTMLRTVNLREASARREKAA